MHAKMNFIRVIEIFDHFTVYHFILFKDFWRVGIWYEVVNTSNKLTMCKL